MLNFITSLLSNREINLSPIAVIVVKIPPFLNEVHGNSSTIGELTVVYGFGLLVGTSLLYISNKETKQRPLSEKPLKTWQKLLLFTVGVDIAGGVIANLTKSTSNYYASNGKLSLPLLLVLIVK